MTFRARLREPVPDIRVAVRRLSSGGGFPAISCLPNSSRHLDWVTGPPFNPDESICTQLSYCLPFAPFRPALCQHRASRRSGFEIDCGKVDDLVAREKAEMPSWQAFVAVSRLLCCLPFVQLDPQSCHPCTDTPSSGAIRFITTWRDFFSIRGYKAGRADERFADSCRMSFCNKVSSALCFMSAVDNLSLVLATANL